MFVVTLAVHFQICNLFVNDLCWNTNYRLPWRSRSFLVVIASIHETQKKLGNLTLLVIKTTAKSGEKWIHLFLSLSYTENIVLIIT